MGKNKNSRRSYEIDDIYNTIHHEMEKKGHHDPINENYYINISANSNNLKSILILEEDYQVDFNHQNSIATVLRFTSVKYTIGFHESENVVNIDSPEVSITDQDDHLLNLRNEKLTFRFHIREARLKKILRI